MHPRLFSAHPEPRLCLSRHTVLVLLERELCQFWSPRLDCPKYRPRACFFQDSWPLLTLPAGLRGDGKPMDQPWELSPPKGPLELPSRPQGGRLGLSSPAFPFPEVLTASAPFCKPASQAGSSRKRCDLIQFSEMWLREMDARLPYPASISPEQHFPP